MARIRLIGGPLDGSIEDVPEEWVRRPRITFPLPKRVDDWRQEIESPVPVSMVRTIDYIRSPRECCEGSNVYPFAVWVAQGYEDPLSFRGAQ